MDKNSLSTLLENEYPSYKNSYYRTFFSKLIKKTTFIIPLLIILIIFTLSFSIALFTDDSLIQMNLENAFIHPNSTYIFGTNEFGQNFFYLTMIGTSNTIILSFLAALINLFFGTLIGIVW